MPAEYALQWDTLLDLSWQIYVNHVIDQAINLTPLPHLPNFFCRFVVNYIRYSKHENDTLIISLIKMRTFANDQKMTKIREFLCKKRPKNENFDRFFPVNPDGQKSRPDSSATGTGRLDRFSSLN